MPTIVRHAPESLRDLMRRAPEWFYSQSWYAKEAFLLRRVATYAMPSSQLTFASGLPEIDQHLAAAQIAALYLQAPALALWRHWFWTSDMDQFKQRVYVGVGPEERGFEIHRHLHLTSRFGTLHVAAPVTSPAR